MFLINAQNYKTLPKRRQNFAQTLHKFVQLSSIKLVPKKLHCRRDYERIPKKKVYAQNRISFFDRALKKGLRSKLDLFFPRI